MGGNRLWLLNGVLAAVLIWGAYTLKQGWTQFGATHQVVLVKDQPDRPVPTTVESSGTTEASLEAWTDILSRNPFSFDRNDINIVPAPTQTVAAATPRPIALGTIILGGQRTAMLAKQGVRGGTPVKTGETFDGWKIVEIREKSVVVASNGAEEFLEVGRVPIERDYSKTASAAPPTPASNSVAGAAVSPSAAPARTTPAASSTTAPPVAPPGTRLVVTPFGTKLEQDPQ